MKKNLTTLLLCVALTAGALTGCSSGSGGTNNGNASASGSSAAPATSAVPASTATASASTEEAEGTETEPATDAGEATIKETWQEFTIVNPVLGSQLTFYLPEAEWSVGRKIGAVVTADTGYQFKIDGELQAEVHLQAYSYDTYKEGDRAAEAMFAEESQYTKPLTTGNGFPAAVREGDSNDQYYVNMGDLAGADGYYLQVYYNIKKNDDEALYAEIVEALLASPVVADFDAGLPGDRISDDSETLYFPASVSVNGTDIALSAVLAGKTAVKRVQGVYEADGVTYTFYTGGIVRGDFDAWIARNRTEATYGALRAAEERKDVSSHSFTGGAASAGSYAQMDAVVEMEDGALFYNFFCDIAGVEEVTDSHYETASQLLAALVESAEYHEVAEELITSGLY